MRLWKNSIKYVFAVYYNQWNFIPGTSWDVLFWAIMSSLKNTLCSCFHLLQTEAINCQEKYIPFGLEWISPLFDTAHIENSYYLFRFCPKATQTLFTMRWILTITCFKIIKKVKVVFEFSCVSECIRRF